MNSHDATGNENPNGFILMTRWVDKGAQVLLATVMGAMATVVIIQVFTRYVLKVPLFWTEELARYLMIWAAILGAALGVGRGVHTRILWFVDFFPPPLQALIELLTYVLMMVFVVVTIVGAVNLLPFLKFQVSPAMRISMVYPYLAVPTGCGIMMVLMAPNFLQAFRKVRKKRTQ
jgi:C4-dicarboxylate transporter DctQ subunit